MTSPPSPPSTTLHDDDALAAALVALQVSDPDGIGRLVASLDRPPLRRRPAGFAGLAAIVVGQQLSTASAAAILDRLETAVQPLTSARLRDTDDATLRGCGLSLAKIRTLRAIASAAVEGGTLDFGAVSALPVHEVRRRLLTILGVGPWTVEIFLLFCLDHADAWPAGDIAIQEAIRSLFGLRQRPGFAETARIGARWRPHRGAAATLLWASYRQMRTRGGGVPPPVEGDATP